MTQAFAKNRLLLGFEIDYGVVFEGDTYCIKHQEILTLGLEMDSDGNFIETCGYCEWGDE